MCAVPVFAKNLPHHLPPTPATLHSHSLHMLTVLKVILSGGGEWAQRGMGLG